MRVLGKIMLDFQFKDCSGNGSNPPKLFREEFHIIETLIHPIVVGLPFLQKHRAILSLERDLLFIGDSEFQWHKPLPFRNNLHLI